VEEEQHASGAAERPPGPEQSSKWSLKQLREHFKATGQDYDLMMARIKELVIKSLLSVEPVIASTWHSGANFTALGGAVPVLPHQTCFEVYGFDVMVDKQLKAWLLEVNVFPSFASSSPFDKRVKTQLMADTLTMVGVLPFDHELVKNAVKAESAKRLHGIQPRQHLGRSHSAAFRR